MNTLELLLAQAAPEGGQPAACGAAGPQFLIMLLMFVVIYFIMIRPQQKRMREHTSMLGSLKKGDVVITRGGLVGRVAGVQDKFVTIEIQEKVRVRVLKSAIEQKHDEAAEAAAPARKAESGATSEAQS